MIGYLLVLIGFLAVIAIVAGVVMLASTNVPLALIFGGAFTYRAIYILLSDRNN